MINLILNRFSTVSPSGWAAGALTLFYFCLIRNFVLYKYNNYGYFDWDLSFFNQIMWNLTYHGSQYSSIFDVKLLGNHANIIAFLIVPLYKIFPSPVLLILLKLFAVCVAGLLLYATVKPWVGNWPAVILQALYFAYVPNIFGILYEFDFEGLSPIFIMMAMYFFYRDRLRPYLCSVVLLLLVKENMPLIVGALGVFGFFTKSDKVKWGILPFAMAVAVFVLYVFVMIPYFKFGQVGAQHPYAFLYAHLQASDQSLPAQWAHWMGMATDPNRVEWFKLVFAPVIFLSFLSPGILFLVSPIIAQHMLSSVPAEHKIFYHYTMTVAPFVFLSAAWGLAKVWKANKQSKVLLYSLLGLIAAMHVWSYMYVRHDLKGRYMLPASEYHRHLMPYRTRLIEAIPKQASIISSFGILPTVSSRKEVYGFYKVYANYFQDVPWRFVTPASVRYAAIDFTDLWLTEAMNKKFDYAYPKIRGFFAEDWRVVKAFEELVLFERGGDGPRLIEEAPSAEAQGPDLGTIDGRLSLRSVAALPSSEPDVLPLEFRWRSEADLKDRYGVVIDIVNAQGVRRGRRTHYIGYALTPTRVWKAGEKYAERYWLILPPGSRSDDRLIFKFVANPLKSTVRADLPIQTSAGEAKSITLKLSDLIP